MHDFKVGDRVEVVKAELSFGHYKNGDVFTVAKLHGDGDFDVVEMTEIYLMPKEVRLHTPVHAPDVITIARADLPSVEVNEAGWVKSANNYLAHIDSADPTTLRSIALQYLSAVEFLEAREKAAEEDAELLNKRRDELAVTYFEGAYSHLTRISYRRAIDRIIELEDSRG